MTKGSYGGGTYGIPQLGGGGGGVYLDSNGNFYPQVYYGTPKLSVSAGYSDDLEGLLKGPSVSGTIGGKSGGANIGTSGSANGLGFGTPGVGATYGFGPYNLRNVLRNIGESFRPITDEFGQPFPELPLANDSQNQGIVPGSSPSMFGDRFGRWPSPPVAPAPNGPAPSRTIWKRELYSGRQFW